MDSSSASRRSMDEIIYGPGKVSRQEVTVDYVTSFGYSQAEAEHFMSAYESSTPGKKAAMRKRLEGRDSEIARRAAATRRQRD